MARDSANKTLKTPTLKFEPVILPERGRRRSTDGDESDSFWCGVCLSKGGKTTIRGTIDCCDHAFCFVCIVMWAKEKSFCPTCKLRFTTVYGPTNNVVFASTRCFNVPRGNQPQAYHHYRNATSGQEIKCRVCHGIADESHCRLLCDICDSAVHTYCVGFRATVPGGAWFCHDCALSRFDHDKTKVDTAIDNHKICGNFNVKLPVEVGHHNPSFFSLPNYLSPPFLSGKRIVDEAYGARGTSHHLSPPLCGKKSWKGRIEARVTKLEQLMQSLQQKVEDEQEKRARLEDHMEELIEQGIQDRIEKRIEDKIQQHFDKYFTMCMQQVCQKCIQQQHLQSPPV